MAHTLESQTYDEHMSATNTPDLPATAMLGLGSMGGAILHGLLAPDVYITTPIRVTTHSTASAERLRKLQGVDVLAVEENPEANRLAVRGAKLIILAVKPWMIPDLLADIAPDVALDATVISVAAGVTIERMAAQLPAQVSVVRAMPNTPSLVGKGVTGIVGGSATTPQSLDLAEKLFGTVGEVIRVASEDELDRLSAISGSGPAYVFLFIEKLTEAAERLGFSKEDARRMVEGTFLGASVLLADQGDEPAELHRRVTSPNGTTERAIAEFMASDLDSVIDRALAAAITRSKELAAED